VDVQVKVGVVGLGRWAYFMQELSGRKQGMYNIMKK